ncbi:nitrogen fixation protein NifZ [Bradyrhizobium canariense]|uniref:Nitrogen fixation protein NifZ n=1 Tax=Bradyrhizobium canariense TaxID=255045 RepID=A0A1X3GGC7_9BRAD|nr:nitrogen fixation protein NifZ [Bradyrhizobium canariense]OSI65743.1 nitrogen fixation protein NifZ [Bradyrhizobium canariense]OSI76192.1 nitrogen fixation protein NifZ [Bradyrhizobium canariense]OSI87653.1 nitrogen fixation protein NifZ [Bradyrhizobium canariense]OSI87709.1 nitrogen fixation protein NifZ [Bradyrhizobium canariense]OSI99695.1 nitrogen fixation protein NifZ [Bradyrhizobium canariense]
MIERRLPNYRSGQRVKAAIDLLNDGSFPGASAEECLVSVGHIGEIVQVGRHTEANLPIYMVDFGRQLVVGCLEAELAAV